MYVIYFSLIIVISIVLFGIGGFLIHKRKYSGWIFITIGILIFLFCMFFTKIIS